MKWLRKVTNSQLLIFFLVFFGVLHILAIGPYWKINTDTLKYVLGAKSIVMGQGYTIEGVPVHPVPPLTSIIFSIFLKFFPDNYLLLSTIIKLFLFFSIYLIIVLFKNGRWPNENLIIALMSISSLVVIATSSYLLSDIPYLFFSLLILYMIKESDRFSPIIYNILAGLALLAACMTRAIGMILAVSIFIYGIYLFIRDRKINLKSLLVPACIAIMIVMIWEYRNKLVGFSYVQSLTQPIEHVSTATKNYPFADLLQRFVENLKGILFIGNISINGFLGLFPEIFTPVTVFLTSIFLIGLVSSLLKSPQVLNIYTILYLSTIIVSRMNWTRYIAAVVPFIFYYLFIGFRLFVHILTRSLRFNLIYRIKRYVLAGYFAIFIGFGIIYMLVESIPQEHSSPFGSYLIKYPDSYDAQEIALWLKDNTPKDSICLVSQTSVALKLISERQTYYFPHQKDGDAFIQWLEDRNIRYIMVDEKEGFAREYLIPNINMHLERFMLIKKKGRVTLYEFK